MTRRLLLVTLAVLGLGGPALAHISLETPKATTGSTYKAVLRVPHGCEGAATTTIKVRVPEGFINAKPMPKPGWELDVVVAPYQGTYQLHGATVTEGVTEIVWHGGSLPDAFYDEFVFRGTIADTATAPKLFFPTIQQCGDAEQAWIDTTGSEDVETPAPSLELLPAEPAP